MLHWLRYSADSMVKLMHQVHEYWPANEEECSQAFQLVSSSSLNSSQAHSLEMQLGQYGLANSQLLVLDLQEWPAPHHLRSQHKWVSFHHN